jgi:hypothetical protein
MELPAVADGAVAASLSELNNFSLDPELISWITSAASNHGLSAAGLLARLPGELEHYDSVRSMPSSCQTMKLADQVS